MSTRLFAAISLGTLLFITSVSAASELTESSEDQRESESSSDIIRQRVDIDVNFTNRLCISLSGMTVFYGEQGTNVFMFYDKEGEGDGLRNVLPDIHWILTNMHHSIVESYCDGLPQSGNWRKGQYPIGPLIFESLDNRVDNTSPYSDDGWESNQTIEPTGGTRSGFVE